MNTLCLRTRNSLDDIMMHQVSMSWKVAESRLNSIENVLIYNFEGTMVLRAQFNRNTTISDPRNNGRYYIGLSNCSIAPCDYTWGKSSNCIKYIQL